MDCVVKALGKAINSMDLQKVNGHFPLFVLIHINTVQVSTFLRIFLKFKSTKFQFQLHNFIIKYEVLELYYCNFLSINLFIILFIATSVFQNNNK